VTPFSRLLAALGAFFVLAFALSACGDSVPGNAVARVGDNSITRADFNHWFGVAASSNPATAGNKSAYDPRTYGKSAEQGMAARVAQACQDLRSAGTSR